MTQQEEKEIRREVKRLETIIPYMDREFAERIVQYNRRHPGKEVKEEFLVKVIRQGEKMELVGEDAFYVKNLRNIDSKIKEKSLYKLMGDELFIEVKRYEIGWGYYAEMYYRIYQKKVELRYS